MNFRVLAALAARIDKKIRVEGDCWIWTGAMSKKRAGYRPNMRVGKRYVNPFRVLLSIKDGVPLSRRRHKHAAHNTGCVSVRCVNPDHGHWATHAENNSERAPESFLRKDKRMTPGHTEFVAGPAARVPVRDPEDHVDQPAAPSTSAQGDGDDGGNRIAGATTAPAPDPLIPSLAQYVEAGYTEATYQMFVNRRVRELAANGVEPYTIQDALAAAGAAFILLPDETQGTDEPGVMGAGLESAAPAPATAPAPPTAPGPGPFTPPGEGE